MGLNPTERKQLVNALHNYVERAYTKDQRYREFLDHLIELYERAGVEGLDPTNKAAFLQLAEEAL